MRKFLQHMVQGGHVTDSNIADGLAAGSAVTYGYTWLAEVDQIISIIAGILVAISAALSIYLHIRKAGKDSKKED